MANPGRALLESVFQLVLEERAESRGRDGVAGFRPPAELRELLAPRLPEKGLSDEELLEAIRLYIRSSVDTAHPRFLNQLWAGFNPAAFAGEVITALRNTSMYTYEVAPAATLIENELVRKMSSLVGYPGAEGTFVTGGSNANLLAMLLARDRAASSTKWEGCQEGAALTAFVSDQAHYSFERAAHVLGIGASRIRKIRTDEFGRMVPSAVLAALSESEAAGERPFFLGATAGTTVLGAFDPMQDLADIAEDHGLWFHVDGSWGGSVLLSRRWRHLLAGCHRSDSFAWTAHKMMGVPLVCSVLLAREPGILRRTLSLDESAGDYLFHGGDDDAWDLGQKSLQCGRRADVLKLWFSWLSHGDQGYEERIDTIFEVVDYARARIQASDDFALAAPVQSMNVCFRYVGPPAGDVGRIDVELRERLKASGHSMVNYGTVEGREAFRLVVANPAVTPQDVDDLLDGIRSAARSLQPAWPA